MVGALTAAATLGWSGNVSAQPTAAAGTSFGAGFAPGGTLRVAINYGNAVLAKRDADGTLSGVSVDIARELGRRLHLTPTLVPFDAAGNVTAVAADDVWDVAFLARDPKRAQSIVFTAAYVIIDGTYVVPSDSPITTIDQVDRNGISVAVATNSAYDLYLTRTLQHARLVRAGSTPETAALFLAQRLDVLAGVKAALDQVVATHPNLRMIPQPFMQIDQAMAMPIGRPAAAVAYLAAFVEDIKASGFVAHALQAHGQSDAIVAPPA
jgi:polar amino acid transport system substrate-binding protein